MNIFCFLMNKVRVVVKFSRTTYISLKMVYQQHSKTANKYTLQT